MDPHSAAAGRPLFVFAPGAGAPSTSTWMRGWADRLRRLGTVYAFDYPYMREGRRVPDRMPILVAAHREALQQARSAHTGPVFLAGKSMGGRISCHVAADTPVDGIICFGYPLRGAHRDGGLRDAVLRALTVPVLFLQGTRDALCPLDVLATVRAAMTTRTVLHVVEGSDHSLLLPKVELRRRGITQDAIDDVTLGAVATFVGA